MPRFYDGIDLTNMTIQIHFVNANNDDFIANPVNVEASENHIRFGWLVDERATVAAGKLQFEIKIFGVTQNGLTYICRTRPNSALVVEKSLEGNGFIQPDNYTDWYTTFEIAMNTKVSDAQAAANTALEAAAAAEEWASSVDVYSKSDIDEMFAETKSLSNLGAEFTGGALVLYDKSKLRSDPDFVIASVDNIDTLNKLRVVFNRDDNTGDSSLSFYDDENLLSTVVLDFTPNVEWQTEFASAVGTQTDSKIQAYNTNTVQPALSAINSDLTSIHNNIDSLPQTLQSDYYTKATVDQKIADAMEDAVDESEINSLISTNPTVTGIQSSIRSITEDVSNVTSRVDDLDDAVENLRNNITAHNVYDISYNDETNELSLYENADPTDETAIPKTKVIIKGGSGGQSSGSTLTITRITPDTVMEKSDVESVLIQYNFTSVMSDGDTNSITGTAIWKVGSTTVATETNLTQGDKSFNIRPYLTVGTNTVTLSFTDSEGSISTRRWTVTLINFNITSSFNDATTYDTDIAFRYTPNGNISKVVHFVLDDEEIDTVTTTTTAKQLTYTIEKRSHGAHLLDVYMTATINDTPVESNHIYKDIIFVDETNTTPIVATATRSISAKQYDTTAIQYIVYDPLHNPATVELIVDDNVVSTLQVDRTSQLWSYKTSAVGEHTLKIRCGDTSVSIIATIEDIGIDVNPVTDNLVFDFNPSGMSNANTNRIWTDGTYHMTVSDNFDWSNGGYQVDSDGDTYFCVKAGTTASFDVPLFGDEAKTSGKNFKFVYRTNNVRDYDAHVLRCMSGGIGLEMNAQNAILHSQQNSIEAPYCEDNFMEFEFNILPSTHYREMVLWIDAIPTRVKLYETTDSFTQIPTVPITIGSDDCDVWVYRMKSYSVYLEEDEILTNFIADAKNAEEMINRYNRNNILNDAGELDPDLLAERCPDLRIIKLSAPYFTNDKDNKVSNTTVQHIYKNGRAVEDNWTATGGVHKGQGTSSNYYGDSARNIDIDFRKAFNEETGTGFRYGDNTLHAKYAMTPNSVEEAYFNIKLNVASSESANNAVIADDYNTFNPYVRPARAENPKVRDTMEFHPCVVFIQESDPDLSTHREFQDNNWHFYGCGDFGNSKKNNGAMGMTDDPNEFIMEISNNINAQCRWLSDDLSTETWGLNDQKAVSFEFRYIKDEDDSEMIANAQAVWQANLTWVVNQYKADVIGQLATLDAAIEQAETPEAITAATEARDSYISNFKSEFEQHFQANNLCYTYLFTERHMMIDNRAKNTFWHYDPTTELLSCTFDYDNDTAEGNDNEGGLTLRYGLEDTDTIGQKDVYNAADSYIWKLIKNFYRVDLATMYRILENNGAWSATRFLNKIESYQNVKPERLWIYDMQRKYFRPYEEGGITEETDSKPSTTAYLEMMHGSKKHQRRQFEKYQEKYIASKYIGVAATSDVLTLRTYTPEVWAGVEPSTTFHITPYADTYIVVSYGGTQVQKRAVRGQEYAISAPPGTRVNDTETYCYNASMLQSLGDLSAFYPGYVNLAGGVKLRDLLIGSDETGYSNTNFTAVSVSTNPLLEKLNLQNLPNLAMSVNVETCVNMTELLADGSAITGIVLPTGGKINTVHLPATITSFTAKGLNYLTNLTIDGYSNIATISIDNSPSIDSYAMFMACNNLRVARLIGIDWNITDDTELERLYNLSGLDENHNSTSRAVVSGTVHITTTRERNLAKYTEAWPNLTITYDNMIRQFSVAFYNAEDASGTSALLDIQYVDVNNYPEDPVTRDVNPVTPTLDPTISTVYTYEGWDREISAVTGNQIYTAVYSESPRTYTVTYTNGHGTVLQRTTNCPFGAYVPYIGTSGAYSENMSVPTTGTGYTALAESKQAIIPTYTTGEAANSYYLFTGWDQSGYVSGYTNAEQTTIGDKTINALYDTFAYTSSGSTNSFTDETGKYKSLSTLTPVEIYAMKKLEAKYAVNVNDGDDDDSDDFIAIGDEIAIALGNDINFSDVESHEFVTLSQPFTMNGRNTKIDSASVGSHLPYAKLLEEDKDFVFAFEYYLNSSSNSGSVLMQCFDDFTKTGLQISTNGINWFGTSVNAVNTNTRDIIILRHKKGDKKLYVYSGNLSGSSVSYTEITNSTTVATVDTDVVFGCAKYVSASSTTYDSYANGTIYWAKLWNADLGDAVCRDLAAWTHETMNFKVAKYKDYYTPERTKALFTFIAVELLPYKKVLGSYNWPSASLNEYLQKRLYFAMPIEWQAIMAEVLLPSWDGYITTTNPRGQTVVSKSETTTNSNAYVFIPCAAEVDSAAGNDSLLSRECNNGMIKFMSTASNLVGRYADGYGDNYWTRSCSASYADFIGTVTYNDDSDTASVSYWEGYSNSNAVRIMFSI